QMKVERHVVARYATQEVAQRLPVEVLHREHVSAVLFRDFVGMHDVAMIETGGDARFVEEHLDEVLIPRELGANLFDDDQFVEPGHAAREGEVQPGHATFCKLGDQLVASESDRFGLRYGHSVFNRGWAPALCR